MPDKIPNAYRCRTCDALGCKLWRLIGTDANPKLACLRCAIALYRLGSHQADKCIDEHYRIRSHVPAIPQKWSAPLGAQVLCFNMPSDVLAPWLELPTELSELIAESIIHDHAQAP